MPISSSAASIDKKKLLRIKHKSLTPNSEPLHKRKDSIGSTCTNGGPPRLFQRSYSTLSTKQQHEPNSRHNNTPTVPIHTHADGSVHVQRTQRDRDQSPDKICLDRRGLTQLPIIETEARLRLLSLQHNLIINLDNMRTQRFPCLVFLDIYDNQIERISDLDDLVNLKVLLMGKNRLRRIEGLERLRKLEVLDLHGNQIGQVSGLNELAELKVLNLAGNCIRIIGVNDVCGLKALQELNLRRNKLKKLLGFEETINLQKLFLSHNEISSIDDISSLVKSANIHELSIENNPITLAGDCVSFLVSYLPKLQHINAMQVTDQVRKAAMAWRRNKEASNASFMTLGSDVTLNGRREEVISNARTNWELIRSQTKCLSNTSVIVEREMNLKPENDIILTKLVKHQKIKAKPRPSLMNRSSSQDTENTSSSGDLFRLPPILVPIVNKLEQCSVKESVSSSVNANVDSSLGTSHSESESTSSDLPQQPQQQSENNTDTSSNISTNTSLTNSSNKGSEKSKSSVGSFKSKRNAKSASVQNNKQQKPGSRAATAKPKRAFSPGSNAPPPKEREQGGDYLIEICGRFLNVYGQGALRFIDKTWSASKANDVTTINFNYANFNQIATILCKIKDRFPHAECFVFKETHIHCLGQLNALAEIQGLTSLTISRDGNAIFEKKDWKCYALYRLSHWGLRTINDVPITDEEIQLANEQYQGLSDIVFNSLPDVLLQPLLVRLRIDVSTAEEINAKKWLMSADPALRSVVSKEALQWKKTNTSHEDLHLRQKARSHMNVLITDMCDVINKFRLFEERWPSILNEIVRNTLLDYTQLEMHMKRKLQELY